MGSGYYEKLEVSPRASRDEIVSAYRRLALGVHPDAHPEDPDAPRRFREITEAYEVLSDPGRRAAYDRETRAQPPATPSDSLQLRAQAPGRGGSVPLVAGPVRIEPSATTGEARSWAFALGAALSQLLSRWSRP